MRRLLILSLGASMLVPAAASAVPADVTFRAEGANDTLVPRTAVRTTDAPVNRDGQPGHVCSGTSALGALNVATAGNWNGTWFDGLKYSVESIRGESHTFPQPDFFELWVNNKSSALGACDAELQAGDDVLFLVARCEFDGMACTNPPVLPLGLTAPARATPGAPFGVRVVEYSPDGTATPTAGATVTGGAAPAQTDAAGNATVTLTAAGAAGLRAAKAGRVRSATQSVCATTGTDGACGSGSGGPGAPLTQPDRTAPPVSIKGIREGQRFARGKGPRSLRASIAPDPSGILSVKFRLTRTDGPRCSYFSGRKERQVRSKCGAGKRFAWFKVGDREEVDYLLPGRLPRGRYVFDVNVIDKAFNRADERRRGANRIVFVVR